MTRTGARTNDAPVRVIGVVRGSLFHTLLFKEGFINDLAVEQMDSAIGVARVSRIVGHHADCSAFPMQFTKKIHNGFAVSRIEVSGRFVGEKDGRLTAES